MHISKAQCSKSVLLHTPWHLLGGFPCRRCDNCKHYTLSLEVHAGPIYQNVCARSPPNSSASSRQVSWLGLSATGPVPQIPSTAVPVGTQRRGGSRLAPGVRRAGARAGLGERGFSCGPFAPRVHGCRKTPQSVSCQIPASSPPSLPASVPQTHALSSWWDLPQSHQD